MVVGSEKEEGEAEGPACSPTGYSEQWGGSEKRRLRILLEPHWAPRVCEARGGLFPDHHRPTRLCQTWQFAGNSLVRWYFPWKSGVFLPVPY